MGIITHTAYHVVEYLVARDNTVKLHKSFLEVRPYNPSDKATMIAKMRDNEITGYDKVIYKEIASIDKRKIDKVSKQNKKYEVPQATIERSKRAVNQYLNSNPDIIPTS